MPVQTHRETAVALGHLVREGPVLFQAFILALEHPSQLIILLWISIKRLQLQLETPALGKLRRQDTIKQGADFHF